MVSLPSTHGERLTVDGKHRHYDTDGCLLGMDGTIYLDDRLFPFSVPFSECRRARSRKRYWLRSGCLTSPEDYRVGDAPP